MSTLEGKSDVSKPGGILSALADAEGGVGGEARAWDLRGKSVYMLGIGGSGMSGMARMLVARGASVRGSEATASALTAGLARDGIGVDHDQSRAWLPDGCDLVVASAAIKPDHPQMLEADRRGVPHVTYAEALGRCMLGRTAVCIAGTHGKSTTTAMLSCVLCDAGLDPTAILGATCAQLSGSGGNAAQGFRLGGGTIPAGARAGKPGLILAESCEFNRSFHNYHPTIGAITSVEADHLDIYGSLDAVVQSFREFAGLIAPAERGGLLLIAHSGAHRREVTAGLSCAVQTIGFHPDADWYATYDAGTRAVKLIGPDKRVACEWTMLMPGAHNAMNAATAAALAINLGVPGGGIARSLSAFRGLDRRSQLLGTWRAAGWPAGAGVRVYDDYGHHPTEVEATLRAMRQFDRPESRVGAGGRGRLVCVFQPHQHSRTRHLMEEFAASFGEADVVIVPHIYFVRDTQEEKQKVTAGDLVDRLRHSGVQAMHLYPFEAIVEHLQAMLRPEDLLVVMGAGPVNEVAYALLGKRAEG
ncbi:MAG: Mur ligase domain-containing protein [Phycisphaeraceae bacterium]|nr:Mur ligase domain-containing protein [Phycisphaeraceae bacterium]